MATPRSARVGCRRALERFGRRENECERGIASDAAVATPRWAGAGQTAAGGGGGGGGGGGVEGREDGVQVRH